MQFLRTFGVLTLLLLGLASPAKSQGTIIIGTCGTLASPLPLGSLAQPLYLDTTGKLCVAATANVSVAGFTPSLSGARGTPLTVTTSDSTGTLPTGTVVVVTNVGATNPMYCNVNGIAATVGDQPLTANGGQFAFTKPVGATALHCIATGGSTTANMLGGDGLPGGATGGGGGSGGGGGAVTIASGAVASGAYSSGSIASGAYASGSIGSGAVASGAVASGAVASGAYAAGSLASGAAVDGWDLTQGAKADAACAGGGSSCSINARLAHLENLTAGALPAGTAIIGSIQPATSGGWSVASALAPNNNTAVVIKASAGQLGKMAVYNNSAVVAYLKIYNATSATCGSGTPVERHLVPAATSGGAGVLIADALGVAYSTGITYCLVTLYADNDNTAVAANAYIVNVYFK